MLTTAGQTMRTPMLVHGTDRDEGLDVADDGVDADDGGGAAREFRS